jgi:hypothetical protein
MLDARDDKGHALPRATRVLIKISEANMLNRLRQI